MARVTIIEQENTLVVHAEESQHSFVGCFILVIGPVILFSLALVGMSLVYGASVWNVLFTSTFLVASCWWAYYHWENENVRFSFDRTSDSLIRTGKRKSQTLCSLSEVASFRVLFQENESCSYYGLAAVQQGGREVRLDEIRSPRDFESSATENDYYFIRGIVERVAAFTDKPISAEEDKL